MVPRRVSSGRASGKGQSANRCVCVYVRVLKGPGRQAGRQAGRKEGEKSIGPIDRLPIKKKKKSGKSTIPESPGNPFAFKTV